MSRAAQDLASDGKMESDAEQNAINAHVGRRLRSRRELMKISQKKLGEHLGVSFQQIQKFEKGASRIAASQLFHVARLLQVDPNYFYSGLKPGTGFSEAQNALSELTIESTAEGIALHKAFMRIRSAKLRKRVLDLVAGIADSVHESDGRRSRS